MVAKITDLNCLISTQDTLPATPSDLESIPSDSDTVFTPRTMAQMVDEAKTDAKASAEDEDDAVHSPKKARVGKKPDSAGHGMSQDGCGDESSDKTVVDDDDEVMVGSPPPPPAPKGCPDDVWQAMNACMRFQMKQVTKDMQEVVKSTVGEQVGGINTDLQSMKSDLTSVRDEVTTIKVQSGDFSKRLEALESGRVKGAAASPHKKNPYEEAAAADSTSGSQNNGVQSSSPFSHVPVEHANWRSNGQQQQQQQHYNGWQTSSSHQGWQNSKSLARAAIPSPSYEEVSKDGMGFIVGGWDFNTSKDKINKDLESLKALLSEPTRKMIRIFRAGGQLSRVANCQMVPQTTRREFQTMREEMVEVMETHCSKLSNGIVPYIALKKDPDTRLVDRKMGEVSRAICSIRGCEFKL